MKYRFGVDQVVETQCISSIRNEPGCCGCYCGRQLHNCVFDGFLAAGRLFSCVVDGFLAAARLFNCVVDGSLAGRLGGAAESVDGDRLL